MILFITTIIPICVVFMINIFIKNNKKRVKFLFGAFYSFFELLFFIRLLYQSSYIASTYNIASYFITYKNGFISRGLIGTLFKFLFKLDNLFLSKVVTTNVTLIVLCWIMEIYLFYNVLKKNNGKWKLLDDYLLLFITSFCSIFIIFLNERMRICPCTLYRFEEFLKLDIFLVFFTLIILICFCKKSVSCLDYILAAILAAINNLIHQGAFFTYNIPITLIVLLDAFYFSKDKNKKIMAVLFTGISMISFLICQFIDFVPFNVIVKDYCNAKNESGLVGFLTPTEEVMIQCEYKFSVLEHFNYVGYNRVLFHIVGGLEYALLYCSHLSYFLLILLISNRKKIKINKVALISTIFVIISFKTVLLCTTTDWIRWIAFMIQEITFVLIYIFMKTDNIDIRNNEYVKRD